MKIIFNKILWKNFLVLGIVFSLATYMPSVSYGQAGSNNQKQAQENAADKKQQGGKSADMLGKLLMAAGMIMIMMSQMPGMQSLLPPGMQMLAGGMGAMSAGGAMKKNANEGKANAANLDSLSNLGNATVAKHELFKAKAGNAVGVGGEDLTSGKAGEIFDKFEAATGINRDDFVNALDAGIHPAEILQGQGGLTKDQLKNGMDAAMSSGTLGQEEMEKLAEKAGLSDLYKQAFAEGTDFSGGSRSLASASNLDGGEKFDYSKFLTNDSAIEQKMGAPESIGFRQLSSQVQAQLIKEGRAEGSLFQLISTRYRKLTPILFGADFGLGGPESGKKIQDLENL